MNQIRSLAVIFALAFGLVGLSPAHAQTQVQPEMTIQSVGGYVEVYVYAHNQDWQIQVGISSGLALDCAGPCTFSRPELKAGYLDMFDLLETASGPVTVTVVAIPLPSGEPITLTNSLLVMFPLVITSTLSVDASGTAGVWWLNLTIDTNQPVWIAGKGFSSDCNSQDLPAWFVSPVRNHFDYRWGMTNPISGQPCTINGWATATSTVSGEKSSFYYSAAFLPTPAPFRQFLAIISRAP